MRLYVVGTDTGVGKTRVTAALAFAHASAVAKARAYARSRSGFDASELSVEKSAATIVKLVQTGLPPEGPGDANDAANVADAARRFASALARAQALGKRESDTDTDTEADSRPTPWRELARFLEPADPWNAALAEDAPPPEVAQLVAAIDAIGGDLIVEGSGGAAVPLDATHTISDVARAAGCAAVIVVGLRLGCINHAYLTLAYLQSLGMPVRGAITTEPFGAVTDAYHHQVERALVAKGLRTRHLAWDPDAARSVARAAPHLVPFLENR